MTNANDTRDTPAPANKIEQTAQPWATGHSAPLIPWAPAQRAVFTDDGQPTELRALTMEEAEAQAAHEAKASKKEQKLKRLFPRRPATTPARVKAAPKQTERFLKVAMLPGNFSRTPWIRLSGQWLEQAGFTLNSRVRVQVEQGRLTITPEDAPA